MNVSQGQISSKSINYNKILQVNDQLNDELSKLGSKFDMLNNMEADEDNNSDSLK